MSTKKKFIPTVSVIIPMYNVEEYIEECLQSLLKQTLKDIEVIVVDDCSTDKSVAVVKKFQRTFNGRLFLIQLSQNMGCPGLPRNLAMQQAHGKYVYFLDSDDSLAETALEDFYKVAEEFQADVVHAERCFCYTESIDEVKFYTTQQGEFVETTTLETEDIGKRVEDFIRKKYLWWACNKLFRRKLLEENNITFPKMTSFEDYVFAFQCVVAAKNYVRVPLVNYYYRMRDDSLSHKGRNAVEVIRNMAEAIRTMDKFMRERKYFIENPQSRYAMIDFFVQWRLDVVSQWIFIKTDLNLPELYALLQKNAFSGNPKDNSALESYLFITTGLYKLFFRRQENKIAQLQNQLAQLQPKEE